MSKAPQMEIYVSSTLGEIPLSFTGRHLLQTLREAVHDAISTGDYNTNEKQLSFARGKIAQYMSKLETRQMLCHVTDKELVAEVERRLRTRGTAQEAVDQCAPYVTKGRPADQGPG